MKNITIPFLILSFLLLSACKTDSNTASIQTVFYVSSVTDPSTQEPFHEVLVQKNETLWKYSLWENKKTATEEVLSELKEKDELRFEDETVLKVAPKFTLHENLFAFVNEKEFLFYVESPQGQKIKTSNFTSLVEGRIFETTINALKTPNSKFDIVEKIQLGADEISYYWEYYYAGELMHSEKETTGLSYFEVENQLFLVPSNQENPYPIFQVVKAHDDALELAYFTNFERKTKSYLLAEEVDSNTYNAHRLCKDSFQSIYYFDDDVRYAKGLAHLLNYLQEDAPKTDGDGFVNLHFTINCNGEVGRFGLELLDRTYQPTDFDPELIKHIVDKILLINDWDNLSQVNYRGAKDTKMFFLIQIANQQIVEVCP